MGDTVRERVGEYDSLAGGLNLHLGSNRDPLELTLHVNSRLNEYKAEKTTSGELKEEEIIYSGGYITVFPLSWLFIRLGYTYTDKDSNEDVDVYNYNRNRYYLGFAFTIPLSREYSGLNKRAFVR